MKKKTLFLLISGGFLLLSDVQGAGGVVWSNHGPVYSSGSDNDNVSIYIGGDMEFATPDDGTSVMKVDKSRIQLTGNLLNNVTEASASNLFDFTAGNQGVVEFRGSAAQEITTSATSAATIPSKLENYINFPNIEINNNKHVTLDASLAAKTQDIELTKGWLILDSRKAIVAKDGVQVNVDSESVLAHLLVEGDVEYRNASASAPADRGFIQVNMALENEGTEVAQSIVGFGIPFREIRSDYFMFNTMLAPNHEAFINHFITPEKVMEAGRGYVVGIDLRGPDPAGYEDILDQYASSGLDFSQRVTEKYEFNRHKFQSSPNAINNHDVAVAGEKLNTTDVVVTGIQTGYNYLANPYTVPLSIDKLLVGEGNNADATWKVYTDELAGRPQVRNEVWILEPNSNAKQVEDWPHRSTYTYNYYVARGTGGTYVEADGNVVAVAPLQMFVIRAYPTIGNVDGETPGTYKRATNWTPNTITIPRSERVMGKARFLRNAPAKPGRKDDFVIEFRDKTTRTTDRVSFVLRSEEEFANNTYSNVDRLISTSTENDNNIKRSATTITGDFEQSLASQIYTKDAAGKALTVQFFPLETTKRITLYHIPSAVAQPLDILGLRINTKDKVEQMWLEDTKYNTIVEITPEMLYETRSEPTDSHERFAIRFASETTDADDIETSLSNIYAYSESGSIYLKGFAQANFGSQVSLYDVNGRELARKTANSNEMILMEACQAGVYIIKVSGSHNQNIKLIVK